MAELAAAGSVVGLISLSIQSCQGLTSYYSAWRSYDEQISQTYRYVDELRLTCEHLERELQNISQIQKPAVEQVVELIASCQDEIHSLRYALDRCHSTHLPQSLGEKIVLHRARLLYPFKKQTLQTLKGTVHDIQGNLGSALQVLQLYVNRYQRKTESTKAAFAVIFRLGMSKDLHPWLRSFRAPRQPLKTTKQQSRRSFHHCKPLVKLYRLYNSRLKV